MKNDILERNFVENQATTLKNLRTHTSSYQKLLLGHLLFTLLGLGSLVAQITVTLNSNATQLANNMVGPGIMVQNATINCPQRASGSFVWPGSSVGISNGILLTTGDADSITSNGGFALSTGWGAPGDNDLNVSITQPGWPQPAPSLTNDACVLEFDLIPNCDTIAINYIFASAEYNTFVNSVFNDAFAFYISGPGIVGVQNIALIPGTGIPITINSVNNGPTGTGPCTNCTYYLDNTTVPPLDPNMEFSGYTTKLTAKQVAIPCSTYHIKFVIADGEDDALDSGVFLEQGGFRCVGSQVDVTQTTSFPGNNTTAVRTCVDGVFTFRRNGDLTLPQTVNYQVAGSVVPGVDCPPLSGSIVIPANQASATLPVNFFKVPNQTCFDSLMIIVSNNTCGNIQKDTAKLYLLCPPTVSLMADTLICPGSALPIGYPSIPKATYSWAPATYLNSASVSNPVFTPGTSGTFTIVNTLVDSLGCSAKDTLTLTVVQLPGNSFTMADTGCLYRSETIVFDSTQVPGDLYFWDFFGGEWRGGLDGGPLQVGWYTTGPKIVSLLVKRDGCVTDTFKRIIDILPLPINGFTAPTPVCWGKEDTLNFTGSTLPGTIYHWNISSGTRTNPVGAEDTTVTAYWTVPGNHTLSLWLDQHTCISDTQSIEILQYPTLAGLIEDDTLICWGDTNVIDLLVEGGDGGPYVFTWTPATGLNDPSVQFPIADPKSTTTYTVSVVDGCGQKLEFSEVVNVRELPPTPQITTDTICAGERAYLRGKPSYDSLFVHWYNFPTRQEQLWPIYTGQYFPTPVLNASTIFWLETEDSVRCRSPRIPVIVPVNPLPEVDFEVYPNPLELPTAVATFIPSVKAVTGINSYMWDTGDGFFSIDSTPTQQYFLEGEYTIELTVVDSNGCIGKRIRDKHLKVEKPLILNVPNAFSPNGDGRNDYFTAGTLFLQDLFVQIFDRWGNLVYQSANPAFKWDGSLGGEPLPEGVYVYTISGHDALGVEVFRNGSITLIR